MNKLAQMPHGNSDLMVPSTRNLPFNPRSKVTADSQSMEPTSRMLERPCDGETINMRREIQGDLLHKATLSGEDYARFKGSSKETSHGGTADTIVPPEIRYSVMGQTHFATRQDLAVDGGQRGLGTPRLPTTDAHRQAGATRLHPSRTDDLVESPNVSDTELLSILRTLENAVERWRAGLQECGHVDLEEVLSNLENTAQRLRAYLHPNRPDSRKDRHNDDHLGAVMAARANQATHIPETAMVESNGGPERRHTREYKQWKDYYLLACRLYETKEERTDPEYIHRFLRGIPGKRALRWVQMGLLHCYPSMVRLSERRSGTSIVFTKDLRWSHVCEMVTRKLKLPFPKWETFRRS